MKQTGMSNMKQTGSFGKTATTSMGHNQSSGLVVGVAATRLAPIVEKPRLPMKSPFQAASQ